MDKELFTSNPDAIVASNRILYTASPFARSSLLHLQEIGKLKALRPHVSSCSNLQSYLFFTVISGSGQLIYDNHEYELNSGTSVFIDCRNSYSHTTSDDLWSLCWVHFNGPSMTSIYSKYCEHGGRPVFVSSVQENIEQVWSYLMITAASADYMRDMLINQYLSTMLTFIMTDSWHPEDKKAAPKRQNVDEVRKYLEGNYDTKITLVDLASRFYMDKFYLGKVFKEQYGVTINTYIQSLRITKAKQFLRFSGKSVEEIGYEVGIGAPTYFSRVFKDVEGVSPKQYREQW